MQILKENKAILVIIIIIIVILAWYGMSKSKSRNDSIVSVTSADATANIDERKLLQLLTDMSKIKLDGHIFESAAYMSLQDFNKKIVPEPVGRQDPFAVVDDASDLADNKDSLPKESIVQ